MQTEGETLPETIPETSRYMVISVAEAAERLGVTQDAVRKRLQRGTLPGIKTGQTWDVIETDELKDATSTGTTEKRDSVSGRLEDVSVGVDNILVDHLRDEVAARDSVIVDLRSRLDWAQSNVDAKDRLLSDVLADLARQRERTDVLQAQYHQAGERIRQLEGGESPESESAPKTPPGQVSKPTQVDESTLGSIRSWLRRLLGR